MKKAIALSLAVLFTCSVWTGCTKKVVDVPEDTYDQPVTEEQEDEWDDTENVPDGSGQPDEAADGSEETLSPAQTYPCLPDDVVAAVAEGWQWGYINLSGDYVIAPQYDSAGPFENNVAAVCKDGQWKLIDKNNETLAALSYPVSPMMTDGERYEKKLVIEGMIIITDDTTGYASVGSCKFGFADTAGNIVVEPRYYQVRPFQDGLAAVNFGTDAEPDWGFIDKTGAVIIPGEYFRVEDFSDGLAYVERDQNEMTPEQAMNGEASQFIDHSGNPVIHGTYTVYGGGFDGMTGFLGFTGQFHDGVAPAYVGWLDESPGYETIQTGLGIIDKEGNVLFQTVEYTSNQCRYFGEGLLSVSGRPDADGYAPTGFMDTTGAIVISPTLAWKAGVFDVFSEGFCKVYHEGMYGYIDKSGKMLTDFKYYGATNFSNSHAAVSEDYSTWGFIDITGNMVIPARFEQAMPFTK